MNLKFLLAVIAIGAVMFFAGSSLSLFRETFLNSPRFVEELPLTANDSVAYENFPQKSQNKVQTSVPQNIPVCHFATSQKTSHQDLVLNEVAWMGNGESALNEWIELKNISQSLIDVSGWQLQDKDEQINFVFPKNSRINAQDFYLLERKGEATALTSNALYTGNLKNTDEGLRLFDAKCDLIDEVLAAPNWPAGDNNSKRTMERGINLVWQTSVLPGGTPRAENSKPSLIVTSKPIADILASNSPIIATASIITVPQISPTSSTNYSLPTANLKVLISEIMVGMDGNANYEFIELYNPNVGTVDLTGWKITKKTSSGSESTLVASKWLDGKILPAGKYFLLGNSSGYNSSVVADVSWPASYTLAYTNNAVVLYDGNGVKVEEVGWPEIPKGQSWTRSSWESSNFSIQSVPNPQNSETN